MDKNNGNSGLSATALIHGGFGYFLEIVRHSGCCVWPIARVFIVNVSTEFAFGILARRLNTRVFTVR